MASTKVVPAHGQVVQTTSATPVIVGGEPLFDSSIMAARLVVIAKTATIHASWVFLGTVRRRGSNAPVFVGSPVTLSYAAESGAAAWDAAFVISGNLLAVQFTGAAATTIDWSYALEITNLVQ